MGPRKINETNNIVVVSDIHAGCKLALCPPKGVRLDDGGKYMPSEFQRQVWKYWQSFWDEWVPVATKKEPYTVVVNGDVIEGNHHRASTPISVNPADQCAIAKEILEPIAARAKRGFYMVRGTEAHVGISAATEEGMGRALGAIPNKEGQCCRWDLWKQVGDGKLAHFLHHIGTTGSQSYEATAVHKELIEEFVEAARWRRDPPDAIVRSHRHRHFETTIATGKPNGETGRAYAVVTPAWQGKTPFVWKIPGGRLSTPQFGGILIRFAHDVLFVQSKVWTVDRSETE
jgi:hypothetical protein